MTDAGDTATANKGGAAAQIRLGVLGVRRVGVTCLVVGPSFILAVADVAVDLLAMGLAVLVFELGGLAAPLLLIGRTGQLHPDRAPVGPSASIASLDLRVIQVDAAMGREVVVRRTTDRV